MAEPLPALNEVFEDKQIAVESMWQLAEVFRGDWATRVSELQTLGSTFVLFEFARYITKDLVPGKTVEDVQPLFAADDKARLAQLLHRRPRQSAGIEGNEMRRALLQMKQMPQLKPSRQG